jgi:hypothetical protein
VKALLSMTEDAEDDEEAFKDQQESDDEQEEQEKGEEKGEGESKTGDKAEAATVEVYDALKRDPAFSQAHRAPLW